MSWLIIAILFIAWMIENKLDDIRDAIEDASPWRDHEPPQDF